MKKQIELTVEQARSLINRDASMDLPEFLSHMDKLIRSNFTEEELNPKPELPKSWKELKGIVGYYVNTYSRITSESRGTICSDNKNIFVTEKQAKSALAMAQLSQLMRVYNGGWEADWSTINQNKFCIIRIANKIILGVRHDWYTFLSFKTYELRDEFLKNFEPLIKEYFMLD